MRLHNFISANMEAILLEWEAFARTIQPAGGDMDVTELRDHAHEMLLVIVKDMPSAQTEVERTEKSQGISLSDSTVTAAETHADGRLQSGFSITLLVAEYRALRASVLRLWFEEPRSREQQGVEDVIRFNEAIDQSLAESVARYSDAVKKNSDVFLGMLGHDLRSPLQSINFGAEQLKLMPTSDSSHTQLAFRMLSSALRMKLMLDNLMDFTQSRIGGGLRLSRSWTDMSVVVEQVTEEFRSSHPSRSIRKLVAGDCIGNWDASRIGQICQNLIGNALQHGSAEGEIVVSCEAGAGVVSLSVYNVGNPIPEKAQKRVFDLGESTRSSASNSSKNVGLGLYIVRELVVAHQGTISVTSSQAAGTSFRVELPVVSPAE